VELQEILEIDRAHIWHPYTSASKPLPVYAAESANGCNIRLACGRELTDGMSSWWCAIHGYGHPKLNAAAAEQISKMSHIMFGGLTHRPAAELAKKLMHLLPGGLEKIFYSDSGSVAVEVAMKMAVQYWMQAGKTSKTAFACISGGYHGDTWHAMSACDPVTGMHHIFGRGLPVQHFLPRPPMDKGQPWDSGCMESMERLFSKEAANIAALVLEPIVQGAGGMRFYQPEYLRQAAMLCKKHGILLIADEIATGFGRTGTMFACSQAGISPDIMCIGKAITGGYMSFAATICTAQVAHGICQGSPGVFMHGPTFMGNPLACAISSASIDLLLETGWKNNVDNIEAGFRTGLEGAGDISSVADVRIMGAIAVLEMHEAIDIASAQARLVEMGVWLRPFGKLIYSMPPYCATAGEIQKISRAMATLAQEIVQN
jgi:adenosylmethionine---8-amino-7-oxononanoate aminotransferase